MRISAYLILGVMILASGCVASKTPALSGISTTALVSEYRDRALSLEEQDEVQQAIFLWRIIAALRPEDPEARVKKESLLALARSKAAEHYEKATALSEKDDWSTAQRQAVIALRYEPEHAEALAFINTDQDVIRHKVQTGESLVSVAEKYFNDPEKASIIAYFNDLPGDQVPVIPGMDLAFPKLPRLDAVQPKPSTPETDALLAQARQEFKQKKYRETVVLAEQIVKENPYEQEAQFLLNKSYLAVGNQHLKKREYSKADDVLGKITEGFPGLKEAVDELRRQQQKLAEEHYRQGVKYYLNENLTEAIREWKLALQLYPDHARARENIDKTQAILDKLHEVK